MRTPSHLLLTAGLGDQLRRRGSPCTCRPSFWARRCLTCRSACWQRATSSSERAHAVAAPPEAASDRFNIGCDELLQNDPLWISSYNLFHAPLLIAPMLLAGVWGERRGARWGRPLRWLALGLALHSAIDIPTHHDDGPLLFFPLDWRYRWRSPLSYWDRAHGGRAFTVFEVGGDALVAGYLTWQRNSAPGETGVARDRGPNDPRHAARSGATDADAGPGASGSGSTVSGRLGAGIGPEPGLPTAAGADATLAGGVP